MTRWFEGAACSVLLRSVAVGSLGALALAGPASAQLPPIPAGSSDCVLFGGMVSCVAEPMNPANVQDGLLNTGIPTNAPDGFGVKLQDHDLVGTEGGSPTPVDSDYIYAFAGFIYFDSDSENFIPTPTHNINPANLIPVPELGTWQEVGKYWYSNGWNINFQNTAPLYVFSDTPEPAAWTLMLVGLGCAGAALRSKRRASRALA